MMDSPRILALMAGYAKQWQPNAAGNTHPENFAVLPFLLLDEWTEEGYRFVVGGADWGSDRDVSASRPQRDEIIEMGWRGVEKP